MAPTKPYSPVLDVLPAKAVGHVVPARSLTREPLDINATALSLDRLAGRFVEITGAANTSALSTAVSLVYSAQRRGALVLWISSEDSSLFPPDASACGVDLESLAVVRVRGILKAVRIADRCLRSGSFGLVVLDIGASFEVSVPMQTRLAGLAKQHDAALICLSRSTRSFTPRLSLVSLRLETRQQRSGHDSFLVSIQAIKDKRQSPGWRHEELCRGPGGLC